MLSRDRRRGDPGGRMDSAQAAELGRQRKRSKEERRGIVEETLQPGMSVARVSLAHGVNANQVFYWRKLYREGRLSDEPPNSGLLPVKIAGTTARLEAIRRGRLSRKLCMKDASSDGLEAGLKHGVELRQHLVDAFIGRSPFSIFKGGDCQTEFELQGVLRMEIAATVTSHDLQLTIDGFDDIGCGKGFPHVLGIF